VTFDLARLVPSYMQSFDPYIPSPPDDVLRRLYGVEVLHRLNNNENPLGPPPAALRALADYPMVDAACYPSGCCYNLRRTLAETHGLHPDQFLVGNGANEMITIVIKAFCEAGDNIVTADRTFAVYEWVAQFSGSEARLVPLSGFDFDDQAMERAIDHRTKIVFVCNPNNPTGTYWNTDRFHHFMGRVGDQVVVVLDEAYAEFVEEADYPNGMTMLERYPNLVVFRTFSKMYGLAGLRVGYLAAPLPLVALIRKTWVAYSVNALAQVAANSALLDPGHVKHTREVVREGRETLTAGLSRLGLSFQAGVANYVMVRLPLSDSVVSKRLTLAGYLIRPMTTFRFPNFIRVSLAGAPMMEGLLGALEQVLEERSVVA
jgi:histidinol-phosphate aminotransferase